MVLYIALIGNDVTTLQQSQEDERSIRSNDYGTSSLVTSHLLAEAHHVTGVDYSHWLTNPSTNGKSILIQLD